MRFILFVLGIALGVAGTLAYALFVASPAKPAPVVQALPAHPPIDVVETHVGSMPMPAIDQLLDKQINARLQSLLDGMPVTITGIKVERDRWLVVSCQVDLDRLEQLPATQAAR